MCFFLNHFFHRCKGIKRNMERGLISDHKNLWCLDLDPAAHAQRQLRLLQRKFTLKTRSPKLLTALEKDWDRIVTNWQQLLAKGFYSYWKAITSVMSEAWVWIAQFPALGTEHNLGRMQTLALQFPCLSLQILCNRTQHKKCNIKKFPVKSHCYKTATVI